MPTAPDKLLLRERMRRVRTGLARQFPDAAERLAAQLPADFPAFDVIASYHPQGSEISPRPLVEFLVRRDASAVVLPVGEDRYEPLVFREYDPEQVEAIDAFGIPAPDVDATARRPDLVLTPLLAFDGRGGRLGQGAGAFDRTIASLRADGPVFVLGLAYAGQEVEQTPDEPHDQRLDAVLTETGYRKFC